MVFIKYVDSHFVLSLLGITIRIKNKNVNYKKYETKVENYGLNTEPRNPRIIASLTSFPQRINKIHKTIECLLTQTVKPDKLILWLAESQFPKKEDELPESLLNLQNYGLTISWCEDLKSYKKLVPALKQYPEDIIITFDDDIYYGKKTIENLYQEYLKDSSNIYTHRGSRLYFDKNNKIKISKSNMVYCNYKQYRKPSLFNTIVGCGGVLYPPHSLHDDVKNMQKAFELSPTQDDIWFTAMAILKGSKITMVDGYDTSFVTIEDTQQFGLCKINLNNSEGMSPQGALDSVLSEYKNVSNCLRGVK